MKRHEENWLRIPYEENADPCIITISDSTGKKEIVRMKVSETRVDYWMAYPLKEFSGDDIQAEGPANRWINAIELSDNPEKQRRKIQQKKGDIMSSKAQYICTKKAHNIVVIMRRYTNSCNIVIHTIYYN